MTVRQSIRAALEVQLAAVSGLPASRSWENVAFTPPAPGVPWVQGTFSPGRTRAVTVGSTPNYRIEGLYLVDLHYPLGNGPASAEAMADAVIAAFSASVDLLHSGVTTRIRYAERGAGYREDSWFKMPIAIAWWAHSTSP